MFENVAFFAHMHLKFAKSAKMAKQFFLNKFNKGFQKILVSIGRSGLTQIITCNHYEKLYKNRTFGRERVELIGRYVFRHAITVLQVLNIYLAHSIQ